MRINTCFLLVDLTEEKFYFIDVQSLCKTPDEQYLPVELAVVEFSLKDGMMNCYHQFLKPGQIPPGMRYECMQKCKYYEIENKINVIFRNGLELRWTVNTVLN